MSLHSPTVIVPAPRTGRVAALVAATCVTAGGIAIVVAGDQAAPRVVPAAEQATTRYFDIEANKVASMRALARHFAEQRANRTSRYDDLEANRPAAGAPADRGQLADCNETALTGQGALVSEAAGPADHEHRRGEADNCVPKGGERAYRNATRRSAYP